MNNTAPRDIRHALVDARSVCERLALISTPRSFVRQTGGVIIRCPWHDEKTPSCSIRRGSDGTLAIRCHGCGVTGDVLTLIAQVRGLNLGRDFREVLIEGAHLAGLHTLVAELEQRTDRQDAPAPRAAAPVPAPPREPERDYPPAAEVGALVDACSPASEDETAAAWVASRGLVPAEVDAVVAGALPPGARLPRWASYRGQPWTTTGHRLIVPVVDPAGAVRSVRAIRVTDGESPKRLPPGGHKAAGLVMACDIARAMLAGTFAPERLLVVEGEPDFLVVATRATGRATARIGLVSGGWTLEFAQRVPVGTTVLLWTDRDAAGERYAHEVARGLVRARGCRLRRWAPEAA
jgi:hypothetical protein